MQTFPLNPSFPSKKKVQAASRHAFELDALRQQLQHTRTKLAVLETQRFGPTHRAEEEEEQQDREEFARMEARVEEEDKAEGSALR
eukprot:2957557-Rhodomonas_salina.1